MCHDGPEYGSEFYLQVLLIDVVVVHIVGVTRLLSGGHLGARGGSL